ncbi:MAG: toprim domain-containing protein [Dehalococcoidia bacterium]|nr:toprim domain-containing protein [Dehalococcoidia bacterium]
MHDVAAIRAAHPIAETVVSAGVELRPSGRRLTGRCPFHRDHDPSFVVYTETASWFCYGCHAGGDVIDFVARLRGTAFRETAAQLSQGLPVLPANVVRLSTRPPAARLDAAALAVVEATVAHCERALLKYRDVRSYLASRGIPMATARRLRLGYAAGGLVQQLRSSGLRPDVAAGLGLIAGDREAFTGRIVVPDLDVQGHATWLTGRALAGSGPRYLNLRAPSPLLGVAQASLVGTEAVVVVEGPFDWLTACEWEVPAVALVGTHASRRVLAALRGFRTVYLALDADGPGRRGSAQIASALGGRALTVSLPRGAHDLNELGQQRGGRDAFLRALAEARTRQEESWQQTDQTRRDRAA